LQSKVFIVVLNFNGWRDSAACLSSLRQLHYDNYEIVVVDNGSTDDSVARIRSQYSCLRLIEAGKNLGFAGGCNLGIRQALAHSAEFIWLLNNDTIADPRSLQALVDSARCESRIGAVGSAIYCMHERDNLQAWGGGQVNFWLGRSGHFLKPVQRHKIEFITGASMLISREVLESIGFLDEGFFMYWEDADFCFRLRQAKWKLAVAEGSKVWHKASASVGPNSARMDAYFNASARRFFGKHARVPTVPVFVGGSLRLLKRIAHGEWERARAVWAGMTLKSGGREWDPGGTPVQPTPSESDMCHKPVQY
jgi:GT2 family glycosyltransferase